MSEQNPNPYPAWGAPVPAAPAPQRRRTALLVAGALVAVAALGGGGYALLGPGDGKPLAKPTATPTGTPSPAKAYGVTAGGTHYGDLGRLLLPVGDMEPGPDFAQYGNDTVLDAARAEKLVEEGDGASHLSASERKEADAALEAMHIKGAALRTYSSEDGDQQYVITLVQVGNKLAAQAGPETFRKLAEGSAELRKGPAVAGHPHAVCVMPKGSSSSSSDDGEDGEDGEFGWLDAMYCQATEGDLMVQVLVDGPAPLSEDAAADVVARQLDRVQAPGEGV